MSNSKNQQWKKRVNVVQAIYSFLIYPIENKLFLDKCHEEYNFDAAQLSIIECVLNKKTEIITIVNQLSKSSWHFESLNFVDQAILLATIAESITIKTPKSILINEAIKTAKNFSEQTSFKFINAILDKILK